MNRSFGITLAALAFAAGTSTMAFAQTTGGSSGAPDAEAHGAASPTVMPSQTQQGTSATTPCQPGRVGTAQKTPGSPSAENAGRGC